MTYTFSFNSISVFFFSHEPWTAPYIVQKNVSCIIGVHYPKRIVDLPTALIRNNAAMNDLRTKLIAHGAPFNGPPHCRPSNNDEIRKFFWLPNDII